MKIKAFISWLREDDRGATAVEYGLICAMIVLAMLTALRGVAEGSMGMWNKISTETEQAVTGATAA